MTVWTPRSASFGSGTSDSRRDTRAATLDTLAEFIARLREYPEPRRDSWVAGLCRAVADEGETIPIQYPLFEQVIAPYLARHYWVRHPSVARWSAHFVPWFYRSDPCMRVLGKMLLPGPDEAAERLLRQGLEWEPNHPLTRRRLQELLEPADPVQRRARIERAASGFDYALHELPAGVLYGVDGATIPQCDRLLEELERFRGWVEREGLSETYRERIAWWHGHFDGYRRYLLDPTRYGSYAEYMRARAAE